MVLEPQNSANRKRTECNGSKWIFCSGGKSNAHTHSNKQTTRLPCHL